MEEPESFPLDSEDVREQIEQQRALAAQLREKLEQDEQQLASKEQQNELLKSKLSLLKSRSKAKHNPASNDDRKVKSTKEPGSGSPKHLDSKYTTKKQPGHSTNKGKINILREQLEQNRLRFERHGLELSEDTRSMEVMVEQLRHELEERDVTIQQLQAGQVPTAEVYSEEKISETVDVNTQLLQKEDEVKNLTNQVTNLQNTILELQENLKEKDCVIDARTQAISLLSEDMSKKWRANVDMLEETRQQMQIMQENFVRIEAGLNAEIEQLNVQLQHNAERLSQAEQNTKAAETARNDLASLNTELQAELNALKEIPKESQGLEEAKTKIVELTQALSEANKLTVNLRAEYKAKVRTLNKQIDSLRKESDVGQELTQLQDHIAELEEEKGNLQLQLIEIEDSMALRDQRIAELEDSVSELQKRKIEAEMRLVELEEQLSCTGNVEQEISDLKIKLEDRENEIQRLEEQVNSPDFTSSTDLLSNMQKDLAETKSSLQEWQYRYEGLQKQLEEKKNQTADQDFALNNQQTKSEEILLAERVEVLEQSIREKQALVQELEEVVRKSMEKIEIFTSVPRDCTNCEVLNQRIVDHESQISALEFSLNKLREENESLKIKPNQTSAEELCTEVQNTGHVESSPQSTAQKSPEEISNLQQELIEASGELELKREECARLENKLRAQMEKVKKLAVNLKVKTVANKELGEKVSQYEGLVQTNKAEIEHLSKNKEELLEKWQTEMSEKDAALGQAAENLALRELDIQNLSQQLEGSSCTIAQLQRELTALQAHAHELQLTVHEKATALENLQILEDQGQNTEREIAELQTELISLRSQLAAEIEEKQTASLKLEKFTKQAQLKLAKEKKTRTELIQKQTELEALLVEKDNALISIQTQHGIEREYFAEEKGKFEALLIELQNQVALLHQQVDHESSKLQFANENVDADEAMEMAQELCPLPSVESFQDEVEVLCESFKSTSPQDVLPILEEEKAKTLNELSSSFETLHNQIILRLQNRSDPSGDCKLFAELKNLVTRVINRTAALESKIKKVVAESNSIIQDKLLDAERKVQTLENSLSEVKSQLDMKEGEKINLEEVVNNLNKEKWDLCQQIQQEKHNLLSLESKLKEVNDQTEALTQNRNILVEHVHEKENTIQDLQVQYQSSTELVSKIQEELHNLHLQNSDLKLNFEKLNGDCEMWKSKHQQAEQEVNDSKANVSELRACYDDAMKRCEILQQQVDEVSQLHSILESQLHSSTEEITELQKQLTGAIYSSSQLQEELSTKSETHMQQSTAWLHEKEQFAKQIYDLTQQLQAACDQVANERLLVVPPKSDEASLRQQLAEKSAELENYQQRLIQLQMGNANSTASLFAVPHEKEQASDFFQQHEKVAYQLGAFTSPGNMPSSHPVLDAFKPAAALFDTSAEVNELQSKIQSMSEQIDSLISEKSSLEADRMNLQANFNNITEELSSSRKEQETFNDLQMKVTELTTASEVSEARFEQEEHSMAKLQEDMKEVQRKLENEIYEKEKLENELKSQALEQVRERPCIPQTLDTHVSSLQDSGTGFNSEENLDASERPGNDESLMESNITQLESELRGMVMSQQESLLKQKAMEGCWDEKGGETKNVKKEHAKQSAKSLLNEVKQLRSKLSELEAEKNIALSQIDSLQAEVKTLSQSTDETRIETASSENQATISISENLMNEDDSWDWGAEGAHLEMQHHQQKIQMIPDGPTSELQGKIDSLQSENESLQKDKIQLAEDLKASQIRAAKLTRKLRDLKAKYDEVSDKNRATDSPFDSLDQAIEEERMKQMQVLEKDLKDTQIELNAIRADCDRLQKQVDVFTSANERLVELKERQDIEVEMWQKRSKDLTSQVEALEWKIQELEEGRGESVQETGDLSTSPKPSQSSETLNPVEIDQLLKENHTWNANYENLMQEYQKLRAQCLADSEQGTQVEALVSQQKGMIERLEHEKTYFQDVYDSLKMDYESVCVQLASTRADQEDGNVVHNQLQDLRVKLNSAEKQLEETVAQLQAVSLDNAELQTQCTQLANEKRDLLQQLEHSQRRIEGNMIEISRLQESIKILEDRVDSGIGNTSQSAPVHEVFVTHESSLQASSPSGTVLNWGNIVPTGDKQVSDIFDSIAASNTAQALEEQLLLKENEMQRERRMIETLKRTMEESEQEWNQVVEYHKNQLESAKKTITYLQTEVGFLKQNTSNTGEPAELILHSNNQAENCQELQNVIYMKEKEIESLQISLAVSEEAKRKVEEELRNKQVDRLSNSTSQIRGTLLQPEAHFTTSTETSHSLPVTSMNIPGISSVDKNLSNDLDHVLYLLHERDVRCEELTLELTQLLEERDGLQLRLSNAIRTNEELRERLIHLMSSQPENLNTNPIDNLQGQESLASVVPVTSSQSIEIVGHAENLQNKLAELRKIGYNHDKSLKEDSEYRHQQQMRLLSPSPTALMAGNDVLITNETTSGTTQDDVIDLSNTDPNSADQSSCVIM